MYFHTLFIIFYEEILDLNGVDVVREIFHSCLFVYFFATASRTPQGMAEA